MRYIGVIAGHSEANPGAKSFLGHEWHVMSRMIDQFAADPHGNHVWDEYGYTLFRFVRTGKDITGLARQVNRINRELYEHGPEAGKRGLDLVVEYHFDSIAGTPAQQQRVTGTAGLYNPRHHAALVTSTAASAFSRVYAKSLGIENDGAKARSDLALLNLSVPPTILLESFFGCNTSDTHAWNDFAADGDRVIRTFFRALDTTFARIDAAHVDGDIDP